MLRLRIETPKHQAVPFLFRLDLLCYATHQPFPGLPVLIGPSHLSGDICSQANRHSFRASYEFPNDVRIVCPSRGTSLRQASCFARCVSRSGALPFTRTH